MQGRRLAGLGPLSGRRLARVRQGGDTGWPSRRDDGRMAAAGTGGRGTMSLTRIGRAAALGAALFCLPAPAFAADEVPLPEQIVDIMNQLWGRHAGFRANHAKGLVTEGSFTPTAPGPRSARPAVPRHGTPVTVRFSDATGIPAIAGRRRRCQPARHSISFHLADGSEMDIVANSLKLFPVATGEAFRELLQAVVDSRPVPRSRHRSSDSSPATRPARRRSPAPRRRRASRARPTTASMPSCSSMPPASASRSASGSHRTGQCLSRARDAARAAGRLPDESRWASGLAKEPGSFRLLAQIAEPGDPTDDPTQALARRPQAGRSRRHRG